VFFLFKSQTRTRKRHRTLSGASGRRPQLRSPAWPHPWLEPRVPAEWGQSVSHPAHSSALCGGPAITPACQTVSPTLLLRDLARRRNSSPGGSAGVASLPPPQCPHCPTDAFVPPFVRARDAACPHGTPSQGLHSAGSRLLRDSPKCSQGQEILIPVQERVCRAWFYLLLKYSAGQTLISPWHQQWRRWSLHIHGA